MNEFFSMFPVFPIDFGVELLKYINMVVVAVALFVIFSGILTIGLFGDQRGMMVYGLALIGVAIIVEFFGILAVLIILLALLSLLVHNFVKNLLSFCRGR
ncbi:hypothetical protein L0Y69_00650 [bacterium]|nr:hypothetical protein [bacterium]